MLKRLLWRHLQNFIVRTERHDFAVGCNATSIKLRCSSGFWQLQLLATGGSVAGRDASARHGPVFRGHGAEPRRTSAAHGVATSQARGIAGRRRDAGVHRPRDRRTFGCHRPFGRRHLLHRPKTSTPQGCRPDRSASTRRQG